jgi:threonine dehydrogenase-like Zn-dependent dehydrogenase
MASFPIGEAMNKNLTVKMGNCNHRKYIPDLLELVRGNMIDPSKIITQERPIAMGIDAYLAFDKRSRNWIKVELEPTALK